MALEGFQTSEAWNYPLVTLEQLSSAFNSTLLASACFMVLCVRPPPATHSGLANWEALRGIA